MTGNSDSEIVEVVSTDDVLKAEFRLLFPDQPEPQPSDYGRAAFDNNQAALCLSGGGIRSAAFALGVVEALSSKGLLTRFQYLSTVSGGGYLGGWLQRWIVEAGHDATAVTRALNDPLEPDQVRRLRANSNFITPRIGLASNDTWTAVATSIRNIFLNWLLLGPILMLVTVPPFYFYSAARATWGVRENWPPYVYLLLAACALAAAWASFFMHRGLPSHDADVLKPGQSGDNWFTKRILSALILWSVAGTLLLGADLDGPPVLWGYPGLATALATFAGMTLGLLLSAIMLSVRLGSVVLRDLTVWIPAFACSAAAIYFGGWLLGSYWPMIDQWRKAHQWQAGILVTVGPIWLMGSHYLAMIVFAGFRNTEGGKLKADSDREWLARLSAIKAKPVLIWAIAAGTALLLNWWLEEAWENMDTSVSALTAMISGAVAIKGGKSNKSGDASGQGAAKIFGFLSLSAIVSLATLVFLIAMFIMLARGEAHIVAAIAPLLAPVELRWGVLDKWILAHSIVALLLIVLPLAFSRRIRVNRFSLNGFYRNRLDRAFLGAARNGSPNPFTGFSSQDNVRMHALLPPADQPPPVLFHVVNVALNVTATENLAWQERKAEPFIFTPLYCGSAMLNKEGVMSLKREGAYIKSTIYGGNEADRGMEGCGASLASAISLSGAAASPNMGYHSSPATALLMTLFNVRLGAWLPNPGKAETLGEDVRRSEPAKPLRALLYELLGSTSDTNDDIYLSDGGHFENLGLYEMLRRRCRYIIVSDAGADPGCSFEDLGNAVRKAKIDLDIDVVFDELRISSREKAYEPAPQFAWALGDIRYPDGLKGQVLYIKPSFFDRDLPIDVFAYGNLSSTFPHEPTSDQFFSESQFESYRRLGRYLTDRLGTKNPSSLAEFFRKVAWQRAKRIADEKREGNKKS